MSTFFERSNVIKGKRPQLITELDCSTFSPLTTFQSRRNSDESAPSGTRKMAMIGRERHREAMDTEEDIGNHDTDPRLVLQMLDDVLPNRYLW